MGRRNYPAQQQPDVAPGELAEKIRFMEQLSDWTFTNDPEKVEQRVRWYFDKCAEFDVRPTVASLALALNTSRQTMWGWEMKGGRLGDIVSQAKRLLNALLEDWSVCGRINPISAVWLQKNHFHYRDTYTVEPMTKYDPMQPRLSQEELLERIPVYNDRDADVDGTEI